MEREREESSAALGQRARQSLHSVTYSNRDGALYLPDWIKDPTEDRASWIGPEIRAGANLLMDTEYRRHAGIASRDCCVWCVCVSYGYGAPASVSCAQCGVDPT